MGSTHALTAAAHVLPPDDEPESQARGERDEPPRQGTSRRCKTLSRTREKFPCAFNALQRQNRGTFSTKSHEPTAAGARSRARELYQRLRRVVEDRQLSRPSAKQTRVLAFRAPTRVFCAAFICVVLKCAAYKGLQ
jgi:hypothetical protein